MDDDHEVVNRSSLFDVFCMLSRLSRYIIVMVGLVLSGLVSVDKCISMSGNDNYKC